MKKLPIEKIISFEVLLTGLANMWFAMLLSFPKRFDFLLEIFPLELMRTSRSLIFISGFTMVILASNIWKRKKRAWSILIVLFALSSLLHLLKDGDVWLSVLNGLVLVLLWYFRSLFSVQSEAWKQSKALKAAILWLLGVLSYSIFGFFLFAKDFSSPVTIPRIIHDYAYSVTRIGRETLIPKTRNAHWFVDSILVVAIFGIGSSFSSLFLPYVWKGKLSQEDKKIIHDLLMDKNTNSSGYFALSGDKQIFFNQTKTCFLEYKVSQQTAIVLGDPIGQSIYWQGLLTEFIEFMNKQGLLIGFVNISKPNLYKQFGFHYFKIGEEAIIPLSLLSIQDSKMADVRHSINRMKREQVIYEWHRMDNIPWKDIAAINVLHDKWLHQKNSPPLTFSVDFYPFPIEPKGFVLTAFSPQNKLLAAISFLPFGDTKIVLELMLRSDDSPNGMIEAAIGESLFYFQQLGYEEVSLGLAPLSNVDAKNQQKALGKTKQFFFDHLNQIYGYKSLFHFKQKFQPKWEDRYLLYKNNLVIPQVITSLVKVHLRDNKILHSLINKYFA